MSQRILIVDDDPAFGEIGEIILHRAGYDVLRVENPGEALPKMDEFRPDIVLSDVEMPGMDGFDFLRTLKGDDRYKAIPFILMSARRTYPPDRVQGLDLGSDDYITKPFSGEELVSRVKAVLRRAGRLDDSPRPDIGVGGKASAQDLSVQLENLAEAVNPRPLSAAPSTASTRALHPVPIYHDIRQRLSRKQPLAVVFVNLSFFRGFNEVYGFDKGDEILAFVRLSMDSANHYISQAHDLVSHVFADDFLAVTTPERGQLYCQALLQEFNKGILDFYTPEDRARGFIEGKSRHGRTKAFPFMNIVAALTSNEHRSFVNPGQFVHAGRELLAYAKTLGGSRYVIDRRKDPPPAA